MALPVLHTFSRNKSRDALQSGKGPDIRIHGLKGNMNKDQVWSTAKAACEGKPPRYRRHLGCILLKIVADRRELHRPLCIQLHLLVLRREPCGEAGRRRPADRASTAPHLPDAPSSSLIRVRLNVMQGLIHTAW